MSRVLRALLVSAAATTVAYMVTREFEVSRARKKPGDIDKLRRASQPVEPLESLSDEQRDALLVELEGHV